jgi:hypothetical protein
MIKFVQKLALPTFVAALMVPLSGTPSPAQSGASRAADATVIASAPYRASLTLTCNGESCAADFPVVPGRRRLTLSRVSCQLHSAQYAAYATGLVRVRTAGNLISTVQFLPADYSTQWGYHVINAAAEGQIAARERVNVVLSLAPGSGNAYDAQCTALGTLETVQ